MLEKNSSLYSPNQKQEKDKDWDSETIENSKYVHLVKRALYKKTAMLSLPFNMFCKNSLAKCSNSFYE
jgi:hypothetical protein